MNRTIDEIRGALGLLAERWTTYDGTERSAAQTFLNQLVAAYTGEADAMAAGARFEEFGDRGEGSGFMDLYWPEVAIVEMKAPNQSRRLDRHRQQVLEYWRSSASVAAGRSAPPYVVLCAFHAFEVWEPGKFPDSPVDSFTLAELPDRAEALLFLAGRTPIFGGPGPHVTAAAARHMVDLYFDLLDRGAAAPEELRRFVVQTVWAVFAEDLGILPGKPVEALVRALRADPSRSSSIELADLYRRLNVEDDDRRNRGRGEPLPYVNGDLFSDPASVHLHAEELDHLLKASEFDWRWVDPTVFGSLLEGCLGHDHRWELGAHYTNESDIMSIVRPVIVEPWIERIESVTTFRDATQVLEDLRRFRVLDPAMGCGNFLAIAYQQMRELELRLHDRIHDLATQEGRQPPLALGEYPLANVMGLEIDPFAVDIARTTLWMTHALIARQASSSERVLPLPPLKQLRCADALKEPWPESDAVVGNPPFHGDRRLRQVVGDQYIEWLTNTFGVGVKDHCVYFFRRAHEHLRPGQRAGFVATNTISQTKNRDASLVWITEHQGVITNATSSKPWSGEAKVHVSIVCWIKVPPAPTRFLLDGRNVNGITPSLKPGLGHRRAHTLPANRGVAFIGYFPNGKGFVLDDAEAHALLRRTDADYSEVVVPFLNGEDIVTTVNQRPTRWVIDFGTRSLEAAAAFPAALQLVRERVKPTRDHARRKAHRERWWRFGETRPGLTAAVSGLPRFAVICLTGKRILPVWAEPGWRPSHACAVLAFEDDYALGVCASVVHDVWVRANSSTLKGDLRYTPSTAFETFPFPSPTAAQRDAIATHARRVVAERAIACQSLGAGLTKVYNLMDEGGFRDLREAIRALDGAVLAAYGWADVDHSDREKLLTLLFAANESAAASDVYAPFGPRATLFDVDSEEVAEAGDAGGTPGT